MKLSATPYIFLAAVTTSLVSAAAVQPTAAPLVERQAAGAFPTDPAQLSAVLANPQSALAAVSSLLTIPAVSSAFRSLATDSMYISQISAQLVSQYGTQNGEKALQSYEAVVNSLLGGGAIQTSAAAPTATSTGGGAKSTTSMAQGTSAASGGGSSSGSSGTNAASGLVTIGAMGSAIVAGAAFVVAAL